MVYRVFLPDDGEEGVAAAPSVFERAEVTAGMVDEAADNVLGGVPTEDAFLTRRLWAMDPTTDVANAFFNSQVDSRATSKFPVSGKIKHTIPYVLLAEEVRVLVESYPEFDFNFTGGEVHDHAMAAACRSADKKILASQIPTFVRYKDIGGSIVQHVEHGDLKCVTINDVIDDKDSARMSLAKMRLKKIAAGTGSTFGNPQVSQRMAVSVLAGEHDYFVQKNAMVDDTQAVAAIMCHVYDIRLEDVPGIMERGNTHILEGCVHFSNKFFDVPEGELDLVHARYSIDAAKDLFKMGFENSPTPWYHHKWSNYMRYGVDQILQGEHYKYSYKVRERRGDTVFFRVLRIGAKAEINRRQYYDVPGVDMVEVDGFEFEPVRSVKYNKLPRRKLWTFPAQLWQTMVRDAAVRVARGGLDYNALVDTYRTAVVPQHLNGVAINADNRIHMDLLGPLVLHAGFYAYSDMLLLDREVSTTMSVAIGSRGLDAETTIFKTFDAFLGAALKGLGMLCFPLTWLMRAINGAQRDSVLNLLVSWKPIPRIKRMKASMFIDMKKSDHLFLPPSEVPYKEKVADTWLFDVVAHLKDKPDTAAEVLSSVGEFLPQGLRASLGDVAKSVDESSGVSQGPTLVGGRSGSAGAGSEYGPHTNVVRIPRTGDIEVHRINAIKEAIVEVEMETNKIEGSCAKWHRELTPTGTPKKEWLEKARDRMFDPDLWYVNNGGLVESLLGGAEMRFSHAAVWCPRPDPITGSHLRSVREEQHVTGEGKDAVTRTHLVIPDATFTGWVFVNESLKIFNGPDILRSLRASLDMQHDYSIVVHQGGPGAGKTSQIVAGFGRGDAVLCPVKASTEDTREKLFEKTGMDRRDLRVCVRTLDSLLVNFDSNPVFADKVHMDELFMAHSGKIYAALALLGATEVHGYGDREQIPHVPRVDVPKLYLRVDPDVRVDHYLVYRCEPDIMALWAGVYNYTLRTPLKGKGVVKRLYSADGCDFSGVTALLVMYQADKVTLKNLYPRYKKNIMTVHESEGKTFDKTFLFNFEMRKRGPEDAFYLFNKKAYCNVAASRSRKEFYYIKKSKEPDLITGWITKAQDPRRIKAVCDVETAGASVEFV
ncbi:replicase [Erysiphe necator associated ssRNA virus 10]|nr:replicase [Erysiphe necator associated ssRNA virus 10]